MDYRIEQACIGDAKTLLALQKAAFMTQAAIYNDDTLPPIVQTMASYEAEFDDYETLKAVHEESIVGSIRGIQREGACFWGRLFVHASCRGIGIGSSLIRAIEQTFQDTERFEIFTGHRSLNNLKMYDKHGYKKFREEVINDGLTLVYLEKTR